MIKDYCQIINLPHTFNIRFVARADEFFTTSFYDLNKIVIRIVTIAVININYSPYNLSPIFLVNKNHKTIRDLGSGDELSVNTVKLL